LAASGPGRRAASALLLPSTADLFFLALAFSVPLGFTARPFAADSVVGYQIRVGSDILAGHQLLLRDRYSLTMAGQPFVPYEWLSEVIFAPVHQVGGLASVAVITGIVVGLTYSLVTVFLRYSGADSLFAALISLTSAAIGLLHWLARPHLFTPLVAILTVLLLERGGRRSWWLVVLLFALWANLHGGFLFGLVLLGVYVVGDGIKAAATGFAATAGLGVLMLIAVNHGQLGSISVSSRFDPGLFPVAAVDAARSAGLSGRVFNDFIWGGYTLSAWPEQRAFIDGQTDFHGDATTHRFLQITELQAGWRDALQAEDVSIVLVPSSSLLGRELARESNWTTWYRDDTAIILLRSP
jgi:hypothetical protein